MNVEELFDAGQSCSQSAEFPLIMSSACGVQETRDSFSHMRLIFPPFLIWKYFRSVKLPTSKYSTLGKPTKYLISNLFSHTNDKYQI